MCQLSEQLACVLTRWRGHILVHQEAVINCTIHNGIRICGMFSYNARGSLVLEVPSVLQCCHQFCRSGNNLLSSYSFSKRVKHLLFYVQFNVVILKLENVLKKHKSCLDPPNKRLLLDRFYTNLILSAKQCKCERINT